MCVQKMENCFPTEKFIDLGKSWKGKRKVQYLVNYASH